MIRCMRAMFAVFAMMLVGVCQAGGSVAFEEVEQLMRAQPATYKWFSSTLELPEVVDAEIRFGNHYQHLGGARMGPYTFRAKVKGAAAPAEIEVTVCTSAEFYDKAGRKISQDLEKNASRVAEKLTAVLVRDARDDAGSAACPAQ